GAVHDGARPSAAKEPSEARPPQRAGYAGRREVFMKVEFLSAVLLASTNHDRLAAFYRDVIGVPLEDEQHGDLLKHYGCELGDLPFAIHPAENLPGAAPGVGSVKLAFEVFDMDAHVKKLAAHGVQLLYPPYKMG